MWDIWTTFVGNLSVNKQGQSSYNTELGTGVDPTNLDKVSGLSIPRAGRHISLRPSPAGRGVGLAHDLPGRQPEDLLHPAMDIADAPNPGMRAQRHVGFQALHPRVINKRPVDNLLVWVARDPAMAEKLGLSADHIRDLHRILKGRGVSF